MARLDLPDKYRDEDNGSVDSPPMSDALRADKRSLTEPHQMTVDERVALAEQDAACEYEVFDRLTGRCLRAGFTERAEANRFASNLLNTEIRENWRG